MAAVAACPLPEVLEEQSVGRPIAPALRGVFIQLALAAADLEREGVVLEARDGLRGTCAMI